MAGARVKLKTAHTLFVAQDDNRSQYRNPISKDPTVCGCKWCGFVEGDRLPDSLESKTEDDEPEGDLASVAASILMKCLYVARMARFDLLRPVQGLARFMTKWKKRHDKELYQLICYIHTTLESKMVGWVADDFQLLQAHVYSDSDFAGCSQSMRSTTGVHTCLRGPNSNFPLSGQSKRQGCISQSTTEAELVAACHGLRSSGLPLLSILEEVARVYQQPCLPLVHYIDNQAMIEVVRTGRNPTMRHLGRVHGVAIGFMHEQFQTPLMQMEYVTTSLMAADIYTKEFTDAAKWKNLCMQINIFSKSDLASGAMFKHCHFTDRIGPGRGKAAYMDTKMPPELEYLTSSPGWHTDEDGSCYLVVKEPKLYRTHADTRYNMRSVWVKETSGWRQVEDSVDWTQLQVPRKPFKEWVERAVFMFWDASSLGRCLVSSGMCSS